MISDEHGNLVDSATDMPNEGGHDFYQDGYTEEPQSSVVGESTAQRNRRTSRRPAETIASSSTSRRRPLAGSTASSSGDGASSSVGGAGAANERRDWSEEFHSILEISDPGHRVRKMAHFVRQFTSVATRVARQIVIEEHLPANRRSVTPVVSLGGIAGGEKFMSQNIFFKFARDAYRLYGSETAAAKAASLELHGLNAVMNARVPNVYMPMMCTVDDLGARVVAASVLPIGSQTLLQGVDDGGANLRRAETRANSSGPSLSSSRASSLLDEELAAVRERMRQVAMVLNLKEHTLRAGVKVFLGADVEWHLAYNKRLYIVDAGKFWKFWKFCNFDFDFDFDFFFD